MPRFSTLAILTASVAFAATAALGENAATTTAPATPAPAAAPAATAPATAAPAAKAEAVPQNDLLNATLWMQRSVEHRAVTIGLFELARIRLHEALRHKDWTAVPQMEPKNYEKLPVAIVSDLDETLLDNSNYEASLITRGTDFKSKEWTDYVNSQTTKAMPGAKGFLDYAAKQGVKIFYVTNRTKEEEPATRENLEKLGFPLDAKLDTILTKGEISKGSDKGPRIASIAAKYRVVLLMGDNFADFTDKAKGTQAERLKQFEADRKHFGHDWIAFPNPEYGSWESAAFDNDWKKSPDQRRKEKIDSLDAWKPAQ